MYSNNRKQNLEPINERPLGTGMPERSIRSQKNIKDNKKIAFAKAFSGSFDLNKLYLSKYATWELDYKAILDYLSKNFDLNQDNIYSRLYSLIGQIN